VVARAVVVVVVTNRTASSLSLFSLSLSFKKRSCGALNGQKKKARAMSNHQSDTAEYIKFGVSSFLSCACSYTHTHMRALTHRKIANVLEGVGIPRIFPLQRGPNFSLNFAW
jgi:hypothetical protein